VRSSTFFPLQHHSDRGHMPDFLRHERAGSECGAAGRVFVSCRNGSRVQRPRVGLSVASRLWHLRRAPLAQAIELLRVEVGEEVGCTQFSRMHRSRTRVSLQMSPDRLFAYVSFVSLFLCFGDPIPFWGAKFCNLVTLQN